MDATDLPAYDGLSAEAARDLALRERALAPLVRTAVETERLRLTELELALSRLDRPSPR